MSIIELNPDELSAGSAVGCRRHIMALHRPDKNFPDELSHLELLPWKQHRLLHAPRLTQALADQIREEYAALPLSVPTNRHPKSETGRYPDRRIARGARSALAERYGIHPDLLKKVVRNEIWA